MRIIAIDVGGTEIKGALIEGKIVKEFKQYTNQNLGKDSILSTVFNVIDNLSIGHIDRIGLVSAGAIDPKTGMIVNNRGTMEGWIDFSLKNEIEKRFGINCFIDNDANGAMIGEMAAYPKVKNAVMITLGTGVGTAVYINGDIYRGTNYQVEFGHTILYPNGKQCTCGKKGCAESYLSGRSLTIQAQTIIDDSITHGKDVFTLYEKHNTKAIQIINEYVFNLATFLESLNCAFDPELFIIGGGVISSKEILLPLLIKQLEGYKMNKTVVPAKNGNKAGILGAYYLAMKG